ncbi:MAG: NAD(P)-binding domain-containing protein [Clostridia bacterium]
MKIGFIGAGKVGTAIGVYLKSRGFDISGYYSRSPGSSAKAAELTGSRHFMDYTKLSSESDIIFITTGDGEIKDVCDLLALSGALRKGQIVAHMSGSLSSEVLKSARDSECWVYSLHPIQSFASLENALKSLPGTYFTIANHLENIELHLPQSLEFYRTMARKTLQVAKRSKLAAEDKSARLESILASSKKGD